MCVGGAIQGLKGLEQKPLFVADEKKAGEIFKEGTPRKVV